MDHVAAPEPVTRLSSRRWLWSLASAAVVAAASWSVGLLSPTLGAAAAGLCAAVVAFLLSRRQHAVAHVIRALQAARSGEVHTPPSDLDTEWASLIRFVDGQAQTVRGLQDTLRDTARALRGLADGIGPSTQALESASGDARTRALAAQDVLRSTAAQVDSLAHRLDEQQRLSEDGQASALELDTTNGQVAGHVRELAESVDETAASIEEMTYSIKEVARNIEDLSLAAEQTATSMNQMDTSISEVESNVQFTSQLADEVARDAGKGAEAVHRTLDGIQKIQVTVTTASSVIASLGERIREIGNILGVIEEVAEQTNLLALNAAIIAAQAGEHGRGFAVVAEEIKDLSDKTGASTKEISTLIKSIQDESRNAVDAIAVGERNVHVGVTLSREAEGALAKILDSSAKSTQRFRTIAAATAEQARGSKIVADAVERIARSVQQVAAATAEQARGSEQLMRSAERIKSVTHQVERTSREQGLGSRQLLQQVEGLGANLQSLREHEKVLRAAVGELRAQLDPMLASCNAADAPIEAVRELLPSLRSEADRLGNRATARINTLPV